MDITDTYIVRGKVKGTEAETTVASLAIPILKYINFCYHDRYMYLIWLSKFPIRELFVAEIRPML